MSKILIVYYSKSGNTEKMAFVIAENLKKLGVEILIKRVEEVKVDDLVSSDGIVVGSPTYYGTMAGQLKKLFDDSVAAHGDLDGKAGAAFATAANIAGGNETTILSILQAMLIHGMIIQGDPQGSHYGPVSINEPDEKVKEECKRFAERFAALLEKVK
ncbi:MAG: NAD(P)H-dependent oxidoreductase [Candidatus Omnitrophota bacterium]